MKAAAKLFYLRVTEDTEQKAFYPRSEDGGRR